MFKFTQRTFNGGVLDRALMGRQDLSKYFSGTSLLKNFLVRRQGNLAKRRGTDFVANLDHLLGHRTLDDGSTVYDSVTKSRLIPIVHDRESGYYALLCGRRAFLVDRNRGIYHTDGTWKRSVSDYLFVPNKSSQRIVGDYVCEIDGVPYATLDDAIDSMKDGETIRLVDDAEVDVSKSVKGTIDVCGHDIEVTNASAVLKFGGTAGREYGIVNSSATSGNVTWSSGLTTTGSVAFVVHDKAGSLFLQGVDIEYPFTGSTAYVLQSTSALGPVTITDCAISASCRIANIGGTDEEGGCDVTLEEVSITSAYSSSSTSTGAFHNSSSGVGNRKIRLASGTVAAASCTVASYGFRLEGGTCRCRSFGSAQSGLGYNKAASGLVSVQLSSSQILSGSEFKETVTVEDVTYYRYGLQSEAELSSTTPDADASAAASSATPFFVEVPYEDGDLEGIDAFQSGDTIFLAHRGYMPARLSFSESAMTLTYETIEFNATTWRRPVITACVAKINLPKDESSVSGSTTYTTTVRYSVGEEYVRKTTSVYKNSESTPVTSSVTNLPIRTVAYVVTYVKDGVESAPSNPFPVSYGAPWESGGKVTLSFSKGANEDDPDYYNIYKKESTEYGLIGSTSKTGYVDAVPEMYGVRGLSVGYATTPVSTASFNGYGLKDVTDLDLLGTVEVSAVTDVPSSVVGNLGTYQVFRGVGGVKFGTNCSARFMFGDNSGLSIGKVAICFDAHTLRYVEDAATGRVKVYDDMRLSGKHVEVTVVYTDKTGTQTETSQTVTKTLDAVSFRPEGGTSQTAYSGFVTNYCGEVDPGASLDAVRSAVAMSVRSEEFVFSAIADGSKQVKSITVSCTDDLDDGSGTAVETTVSCYLCGVSFSNVGSTETSYDDDYITPDLTVTPPSDEAPFRGRGNYPSCVGLYQQRLIYASTSDQPFGFWMSAAGDLYNFTPHSSIREDDAISAELAATEFPNVNHIVMNRDIIMLGDGGEWKVAPVTGNTITYKTVSAELQSSIGSAKWLKPLTVGEQVVFAERTGMTLRSIAYNFSSDGYESTDLSVLSGDLFANNRIVRMCYKQHPDSTIECVLADGTVAVLVYMPQHEVSAWSLCSLGGGYLATDIATSKALNGNTTDVLLTVRKGTSFELWTVRPDLPEMTVDAQTCMDRVQALTAAEAASGWVAGWTAVDRATGALVTAASGLVSGHTYLCGFVFDAEFATVRPEPAGSGTIQFEIKNAKDVEIRCLDGASWKVAPYGLVDHATYAQKHTYQPTATGGALTLDNADVRLVLTGKNDGDGRIHSRARRRFRSRSSPCPSTTRSSHFRTRRGDGARGADRPRGRVRPPALDAGGLRPHQRGSPRG